MFRITEESVSKALIEASKKRQVKIRILLDREQTLASDVVQKIKAEMIAAGIQVKLGTPAFSITHEKAMTLDDSTALISTVNLTKGFKTTRDIGIITRDQNIINEFNSVFEADWKNSDTGLAVTPPLAVDQLVWSPVSSNQKLNALILESKKTLELYVENFTDNKMADSLIKVAELGVNVRVITPLCSLNPNPLLNIPILKKLLKNKVSVKVMPNPSSVDVPYIHAKSIVVDRKKSYVGSINFSINSLNKAREVGIIFLNALASVKIIEKFDNDWKVAINIPDKPDLAMCQ
jgi:phosphatidylserine/phosphatidylglycerophosphate/cardiolipin synthase-like enzyme